MSKINAATFLKDHQERAFSDEREFLNFLEDRALADEWAVMPTEFVEVQGLENCPIGAQSIADSIEGYEGTVDGLTETMGEFGFVVSYYDATEQRKRSFPIREFAVSSLFERAGLNGRILREQGENSLPAAKKAEWLSTALKHWAGMECKLLLRDGKVSTCRTQKYIPLDTVSLVKRTYEALPEEAHFESASVSHEMTQCEIVFGSEEGDNDIRYELSKIGVTCQDVKRFVRFYTSDTGDAAATLIPYISVDGCDMPLGSPYKMVHSRGASVEKWEALIGNVSSIFNDTLAKLKELCGIKLRNPASVLRYGACEIGLPKATSLKFAKEWEETLAGAETTAYDMYRKLIELIGNIEAGGKVSLAGKLHIRENVSRFLNMNLASLDFKFEWDQ